MLSLTKIKKNNYPVVWLMRVICPLFWDPNKANSRNSNPSKPKTENGNIQCSEILFIIIVKHDMPEKDN